MRLAATRMPQEVKAALGKAVSEEGLRRVLEEDLAFIGEDSGSTDPGPYYLGS